MYPVSDAFKTAVYAPSRSVKARVTFDVSDITAKPDVSSITTTNQATGISNKDQLINGVRSQKYNLATYEPGRFKLDGSFSFPDDVPANNLEMGFVSDNSCDSASDFAVYPVIIFVFGSAHSTIGATVTFDVLNDDEYATEFSIAAYDGTDTEIDSIEVTGNTDPRYLWETPLNGFEKVTITIKKWSVGSRRARVAEVDFGIVKTYTDDNLIKCSLVEELDLTTGQLPSAEFKFTVDNSAREFNILNPDGFYAYLQERQPVKAEMAVDMGGWYQYIPIGDYLLLDWTSDEGSLTASFTARTNLDIMANYDYENLVAETGYSLHDMAVAVFAVCGITNYSIDAALESILTNALVKKTSCRNVLQMIALAGGANIYVTRDNLITIKVSPGSLGTETDTVDLDNMYEEPKIELDKIVKSVAVTYWTDLSTSAIVSVANAGITDGDILKLETNTLINSSARATAVANWLLAQKAYRNIYTMNWRGNPAHELADVIAIGNSYGADKSAIITKNSLEYQGYLTAKTEARG